MTFFTVAAITSFVIVAAAIAIVAGVAAYAAIPWGVSPA